jgi:uncharacterized membrane protein
MGLQGVAETREVPRRPRPLYDRFTWGCWGLALALWFFGIAGRDAYVVPLVLWLPLALREIWHQRALFPLERAALTAWVVRHRRWFLVGLLVFFALVCGRGWLRYLSFGWSIWDIGSHSNVLFNLSRGELWWSYHQVHPWANHFTPSISFLALPYLLYPHILWQVLAKTLSYCLTPVLLWRLARHYETDAARVWSVTVGVSLLWLFCYKPAVSSLWYEWQPSSLAPAVIVWSFLCLERRQWWGLLVGALFLLGLKEHMGIVLIGFGAYWVAQERRPFAVGVGLLLVGVGLVFFLTFQVIPYFRGDLPPWGGHPGVTPFADIPRKLRYVFQLLLPLAFLPLLYWRVGILAGPAIGVNWVSSKEAMQSSHYHYDDVSSTLLMVSLVVILCRSDLWRLPVASWKASLWEGRGWLVRWTQLGPRPQQLSVLVWSVGVMVLLPPSVLREIQDALPSPQDRRVHAELARFKAEYPVRERGVAAQMALGIHFQQRKTSYLQSSQAHPCGQQRDRFGKLALEQGYWVLARGVSSYGIDDLEACLTQLGRDPNFRQLQQFTALLVFENFHPAAEEK